MKIAVVGGGAAGYFASVSAKKHFPNADVHLIEKTGKTLSKVKISGGGRCNVTHHCLNNRELSQHYPRGERFLRKSFEQFSVADTITWFEQHGVELKVETDNRMFPRTDDSQTIVETLTKAINEHGVILRLNSSVDSFAKQHAGFILRITGQRELFNRVIIATGGSPKRQGMHWLSDIGVKVVSPVPSLFTFNIPQDHITTLMGVSTSDAEVQIVGKKLSSKGPVLITHWGLSGPAVLKLSAIGARILADCDYKFKVAVSWVGMKEHQVREILELHSQNNSQKQTGNLHLFEIPKRLWSYLLVKSEIASDRTWNEISKKLQNRLINLLVNDTYNVNGKTTFKEEFVTAGGVELSDVNPETMESTEVAGLYFAGEVLDIDGITGGFNFQAAWTTGFIAGKHVGR